MTDGLDSPVGVSEMVIKLWSLALFSFVICSCLKHSALLHLRIIHPGVSVRVILAPQNLSLHMNCAILGSNHENSEVTERFQVTNILLPVRALRTDEWKGSKGLPGQPWGRTIVASLSISVFSLTVASSFLFYSLGFFLLRQNFAFEFKSHSVILERSLEKGLGVSLSGYWST